VLAVARWVGQKVAELMTLERLVEKEAQCRHLIDHGTGRELALLQQIGWVGAKFMKAELVGRLAKVLGEFRYHPQVILRGDTRIGAAPEFLQHHLP
jgi:hypothetical protein